MGKVLWLGLCGLGFLAGAGRGTSKYLGAVANFILRAQPIGSLTMHIDIYPFLIEKGVNYFTRNPGFIYLILVGVVMRHLFSFQSKTISFVKYFLKLPFPYKAVY